MDRLVAGIIIGGSLTIFCFIGSYFFLNWVEEKREQIANLQAKYYDWKRIVRDSEVLWEEFLQWKRDKENK
jgi:hypothetical protein